MSEFLCPCSQIINSTNTIFNQKPVLANMADVNQFSRILRILAKMGKQTVRQTPKQTNKTLSPKIIIRGEDICVNLNFCLSNFEKSFKEIEYHYIIFRI